ncbi:hypothetical protein SAMN06265348_11764 [Pedobacter westerhofensis]|uniref:Permuted papain-like amidase enzyme, YaeF/YiiX, C92 family n=1 Tax=Pedobacter westerhofensis TaxID=425512 RepID=A0A521FR39_9SPHI|nr:hypothetical protein [Pedobacter westerhofensis]SMO98677.1 hypothetical protein SAMN06265348_11764 [Pedobacter westerhofensis]
MTIPSAVPVKALVFALILLSGATSFAQEAEHGQYLSAIPADSGIRKIAVTHVTASAGRAGSAAAMSISREHDRLMNYLEVLEMPGKDAGITGKDTGLPLDQRKTGKKFYYHLANVFARLRLYPLAMKCYFKASRPNPNTVDSLSVPSDSLKTIQYAALQVSSKDDSIVGTAAMTMREKLTDKKKRRSKRSRPTSFPQIISNFNDGKTAVAYALLFHVKQPAPGRAKIFVGVNTGHTFITLIKYNTDSTYSSASFGFYPDKDQLLSATPISPTTSATFKDDAGHLWDEVLGKFISRRNFENILVLTQKFEGMTYNLNQQNCTDFGLQAARLAGIGITDTFGKWPFGKGNNPAVTGQSILNGKISNATTGEELFFDQTVTAGH